MANTVVFGTNTLVFRTNILVFVPNTVVFGTSTMVFGINTVVLGQTQCYFRQLQWYLGHIKWYLEQLQWYLGLIMWYLGLLVKQWYLGARKLSSLKQQFRQQVHQSSCQHDSTLLGHLKKGVYNSAEKNKLSDDVGCLSVYLSVQIKVLTASSHSKPCPRS